MKALLKKLLRDRKGVSLTEVIVAMAVIVVVTGAAISVVIASVRADNAYALKYAALTGSENAVECLRFTQDEAELNKALLKAGFVEHTETINSIEVKYVLDGNDDVKVGVTNENGKAYYVVILNGETIYKVEKQ